MKKDEQGTSSWLFLARANGTIGCFSSQLSVRSRRSRFAFFIRVLYGLPDNIFI